MGAPSKYRMALEELMKAVEAFREAENVRRANVDSISKLQERDRKYDELGEVYFKCVSILSESKQ